MIINYAVREVLEASLLAIESDIKHETERLKSEWQQEESGGENYEGTEE